MSQPLHSSVPFPAYSGEAPYVFISYSHADRESVYPDMEWLHAMGCRIWYDEGIPAGKDWSESIAQSLDACSQFLVFVSPNAVASHSVCNEIHFAIQHRKPFLAIHIRETTLSLGLEFTMQRIQALMKFRLPEEDYRRKLLEFLPAGVLDETKDQKRPILKYCPVDECPANVPYIVRDRLFFQPTMYPAPAGEMTRCMYCGEILENRCPGCGAELVQGSVCPRCGQEYVVAMRDDGGRQSAKAWAEEHRRQIKELTDLCHARAGGAWHPDP